MEFFIQRARKIWFHFFSLLSNVELFSLASFLAFNWKEICMMTCTTCSPCSSSWSGPSRTPQSKALLSSFVNRSVPTISKKFKHMFKVSLYLPRTCEEESNAPRLEALSVRRPEKNGDIGGQSLKEDRCFLDGKISTFRGRTMEAWPNLNVNLYRSSNMSGRVYISATTSGNLKHQRLWVDKGKECSLRLNSTECHG